jgi:hypothetical protein
MFIARAPKKKSQALQERHVVARYYMSPLQGSKFGRIPSYKHFAPLALACSYTNAKRS